jgi:PBSX family phage terminase large subunit
MRPFVKYRRGAASARIFGKTVNIIGANDAGAESKIRGMTIALVLGDEVTVWHIDFFRQLLARMSPPNAQAFLTTNPDSPSHWLKTDYLDRLSDLPGWLSWHFTMDDNPGLSDDYKTRLKAEYQGLWYQRFIEGLWVAAEGAIYPMWSPQRHVVPWASLPPMWRYYALGIDYGTTNATSAILLGLGLDRRLYLVDEWRWDSAKRQQVLTDAEISQRLRAWLDEPHLPGTEQAGLPQYAAVDPAAASLKAQFARDNWQQRISVTNGRNDVNAGIRLVASLLGADHLRVSDRCTGFISEVGGYAWDAKATEKGLDKPIKSNDHSLDAARYAIATTEALWRGEVGRTNPF